MEKGEEMLDYKGESNVKNQSHQQVEKDGKIKVEKKKRMAASKQTYKIKPPTIPKPFSLSTYKRMSRERLLLGGSQQSSSKETKMKSHKSTSLNMKVGAQNLVRSSESRRERAIVSRNTVTNNGHTEKQKQKQVGEKRELKKSTSFKASPLPSFYHKKDAPSKPEINKIPLTRRQGLSLHNLATVASPYLNVEVKLKVTQRRKASQEQ